MGIIVYGVSKPTERIGWCWSLLLQSEETKTVLLETDVNGCQLFRVERHASDAARVLIDAAFALDVGASIFDAIGTMECRIRKAEFIRSISFN